MKVMGRLFEAENVVELYQTLSDIKAGNSKVFQNVNPDLHFQRLEQLCNYFLLDDAEKYLRILVAHQKLESCFVYDAFLCFRLFEVNAVLSENQKLRNLQYRSKLEQLYMGMTEKMEGVELELFKQLLYTVKLLYQQGTVDKNLIKTIKMLEGSVALIDTGAKSARVLPASQTIFQVPYPLFGILVSLPTVMVEQLKSSEYEELQLDNFNYQVEYISLLACDRFHQQLFKCLSIMLDNTQSLVNMSELFSASADSFLETGGNHRVAFSFANIARGFKVLKITLNEAIMKVFLEPCEIEYNLQTIEEIKEVQEKNNFQPKVKIVFHGLEDINFDNPKSSQLSLEILVQTGEDQFFRLSEENDQVLFWNFDKVKQMNLIGNVLLPVIVELTQLSINYMPKDPKEYYDYLSSKIGKEKMVIEKQIVQKWFQSERPHIRASIDSLHQFVEALEFNLMKIENTLNKDLIFHSKNTNLIKLKSEKFNKLLVQSGQKVDYELIYKIENATINNLKSQIETLLGQMGQHTARVKQQLQQLQKVSNSFK